MAKGPHLSSLVLSFESFPVSDKHFFTSATTSFPMSPFDKMTGQDDRFWDLAQINMQSFTADSPWYPDHSSINSGTTTVQIIQNNMGCVSKLDRSVRDRRSRTHRGSRKGEGAAGGRPRGRKRNRRQQVL
ncbi:unnamed protein product [Caretta caretta]